MAASSYLDPKHFAYPDIQQTIVSHREAGDDSNDTCWYCQFWPYGDDGDDPIFCLANRSNMQAFRISTQSNKIDLVGQYETDLPEEDIPRNDAIIDGYCSSTWAYLTKDRPLLLGAGDLGYIRVFDVTTGTLLTTLVGHGKGVINELSTHPKYPWIVASASLDQSIRIWDLRRWDSKLDSTTIIICGAGNGHRESVLTVDWHDSGRYLVSGAFDNRVCVWTIPDLAPESSFWTEIAPAKSQRRAEQVRIIHYPHFTSSAIHENYIDCVRFFGDYILSKAAADNKIVCWKVTGFDSKCPPPEPILAPKASEHLDTRNGFIRALESTDDGVTSIITRPGYKGCHPYSRCIEFEMPKCDPFFIRFGLLKRSSEYPNIHAVLACANTASIIRFWDLEALDRGYDFSIPAVRQSGKRGNKRARGTGRGGRLNQLTTSLSRTESGPASLASGSINGFSSRTQSPSASTDHSSGLAARSHSTDGTSWTSDPLHGLGPFDGPSEIHITSFEPPEDRTRFPLQQHNVPLKRAHHEVDLSSAKGDSANFTARCVAWSPDGRWCVVAGETMTTVRPTAHSRVDGRKPTPRGRAMGLGVAVVMKRDLPVSEEVDGEAARGRR